jgi:hypothetical protein
MDEFLIPNASLKRLINEYIKYEQLIILVDFDNVLYDYYNIGSTHNMVIELVKEAKLILNAEIVIWTGNINIDFVKEYCTNNNIIFDGINEHSQKSVNYYNKLGSEPTRKIFGNILIDDRSGAIQVYQELELLIWLVKQGILKK